MRKRIMAVIIAFMLLFSACGEQAEEGQVNNIPDQSAEETDENQWELKETLLPDTDNVMEDGSSGQELLYDMVDGTIYRIVRVIGEGGENKGICIQKLSAPYTSWENVVITADEWVDGKNCYTLNAALRQDGSIHLLLQSANDAGEMDYYKAQWTESGGHTIQEIPGAYFNTESLAGATISYMDSRENYYLASYESVEYFDEAFSKREEYTVNGYLWQIVENPYQEGETYLCGVSSDGGFSIWTLEGTIPVFVSSDVISSVSDKVAFSGEAEGYVCTTEGIWQFHMKDRQTENILLFSDRGYSVEEVCSVSAGEDGSLRVVVITDEEYVLLEKAGAAQMTVQTDQGDTAENQKTEAELQESQEPEKVELELAITYPSAFLKEAIVSFNRYSEEYKIVLRAPGNGEDREDFQTRIQTEVSSGGGPDLLADDVIDLKNAAEKGMLREMTADFTEQKKDIAENVWGCGEVDGASYAIPYGFYVTTFIVSMDAVGEKESWTPGEMMQYVKSSGAETAISNVDGPLLFSILLNHGKLVDWENGKCYLDSEEAVALLEFAGGYGDKGSDEADGVRIAEGKVLVSYMSLPGLIFSQAIEALFQSREVYIGLPVEDGESGNIIEGKMLSVNQACECPEGAVAFLQYLLAEECQDKLARDASEHGVSGFPVSNGALENMFVYAGEQAKNSESTSYVSEFMGFEYMSQPISMESLQKIRNLLQTARPETERVGNISDIIMEETPAYFSGNKSAQEVCDILQNRVQLYLDEMN